ncbi:uncharacterized protein ARMOST_19917 [Armillaria ostoyae]|uniref:Uncharacterized protein n=1 Tax=Armillaria ostoyae TaxID=47428 RepID=A0A284S5V7_ARMOS|nr:uncharacterized protein ARMOST_19917 [Armillaria ostoyae]
MNPDDLTITVTATIGGACLLSLLTPSHLPPHPLCPSLRPTRTTHGTNGHATNLPPHPEGDLPPEFLRRVPAQECDSRAQQCSKNPPPPAYPTNEAEDYGRYLWAQFHIPPPNHPIPIHDPNPQRTDFENTQTQIWALVLEQALQHPGNASPIQVGSPDHETPLVLHTAGPIHIGTPAHLAPYPDEDSNSDSSNYGGNEPVAEREDDDPLNAYGGDYEWPELGAIDQCVLASSTPQMNESQWDTTSPSPEDPPFQDVEETPPWKQEYLQIGTEWSTPPQQGTGYWMPAPEQRLNSASWSTTYSHWPSHRETDQTWMALPEDFDDFNYDEETFRSYAPDVPGDYQSYTLAPFFPTAPFPLPDSPNWEYQRPEPPQIHPCRIQGYRPPQYGTIPFAGQDPPDPDDRQPGGSNDPPRTREERLEQAWCQSQTNQDKYNLL